MGTVGAVGPGAPEAAAPPWEALGLGTATTFAVWGLLNAALSHRVRVGGDRLVVRRGWSREVKAAFARVRRAARRPLYAGLSDVVVELWDGTRPVLLERVPNERAEAVSEWVNEHLGRPPEV